MIGCGRRLSRVNRWRVSPEEIHVLAEGAGLLRGPAVPRRDGLEKHELPLMDTQRAMGLVRKNAKAWGIDPKRIGMLGFSAGGHLVLTASTNFEKRTYEKVDGADGLS